MPRTIVVLGGALAGPTAAARAREHDEHARIVLVERNTHISYATTVLAYRLSGEVEKTEDLDREGPAHFAHVFDVEVRTGTHCTAVESDVREVVLEKNGVVERLSYDALVYALGVMTADVPAPGLEGKNVRPFRTMQDLEALLDTLATGASRVAVIGGGTLGLEAVDGLVRGGADVTLIERTEILPRFSPMIRELAKEVLQKDVRLELGVEVTGADSHEGNVTKLELSNGKSLLVDYVVLAPGVRPRTELLAAAGVALEPDGSVRIDEQARTSVDGIYACGTCASVPMHVLGSTWSAQASVADKTAQVAGANAAGAGARLFACTGAMATRVGSLTVARTGPSFAECERASGPDGVGRVLLCTRSTDAALARAEPLWVELVWDRETGRVLALEAAGHGAERRVDAVCVAIAGKLTVEELAVLDFAYAPAFGAVRDPLNVAASIACAERAGLGRLVHSVDGRAVLDVGARQTYPGARHIPLAELRKGLGELDKSARIVLVDEAGRDSWLAQRILLQRGFSDVSVLAGGTRVRA
jgi:NADPH-dependent 2,4-dienoyl-CoA reductase/sulfur reductase-like enzyme/rhodanese-related sulfurtransferase